MSDAESKAAGRGSGPTIREVAQRAGVSIKTVSRMLSGHSGVREETRRRIQKVMDGMEYYPSAAARALRGQGTGLVALITDRLTTTPDSFEIIKGVQSGCDRHGKLLMLGETGGDPDVFERLVTEFRRQRPEAVINAAMSHRPVSIEQSFSTCPLVLVNCFEGEERYPTVLPDERRGAYDATKHVIGLGHARIGHLGLSPDAVSTKLRLDGYVEAHREAGLPVDDNLIRVDVAHAQDDELEGLNEVIFGMLALPSPPTVLMCGSDKMAMRTFMVVNERGLKVPEDISVMGFDDYRVISENLRPKLTTVLLPYFEMGARAAEWAIRGASSKRDLVHCPVVARASVRRLQTPGESIGPTEPVLEA